MSKLIQDLPSEPVEYLVQYLQKRTFNKVTKENESFLYLFFWFVNRACVEWCRQRSSYHSTAILL